MIKDSIKAILKEIETVDINSEYEETLEIINFIKKANRIFIAGVGRSGFMMRAFAMRLMHAGFNAYVIGDVETPGAQKGDLLVIGTGSGETGSLKVYAQKAKEMGLNIITITGFPQSELGQIADVVHKIPSPTPKSDISSDVKSIQPMASLFEQFLLIYLDALYLEIVREMNLEISSLFDRHANLE